MAALELDSRDRTPPRENPVRHLSSLAVHALTGWLDRKGKQEKERQFLRELRDHGFFLKHIEMPREKWEHFFGPEVTPANFGAKMFPHLPVAKEPAPAITFSSPPFEGTSHALKLELNGSVLNREGSPVKVGLEWVLGRKPKQAELTYFTVDAEARGKGIGSILFDDVMSFWRKRGIERVSMTANIDVGGYLWPQKGFFVQDLKEAGRLIGNAGIDGTVGERVLKLRAYHEAGGGTKDDPFSRGLDQAQALLEQGRSLIQAGNLREVQLIIPMLAGLRTKTPEFLIPMIASPRDSIRHYPALRADTLGKALLCRTGCEVVYDFNDERARRLYTPTS